MVLEHENERSAAVLSELSKGQRFCVCSEFEVLGVGSLGQGVQHLTADNTSLQDNNIIEAASCHWDQMITYDLAFIMLHFNSNITMIESPMWFIPVGLTDFQILRLASLFFVNNKKCKLAYDYIRSYFISMLLYMHNRIN